MHLSHALPDPDLLPGEEVWASLDGDRPERLIATDRRVIRIRLDHIDSWPFPDLSDLRPLGREGRFGIVRRDGSIAATMKVPEGDRERTYQAITVMALLIARGGDSSRPTPAARSAQPVRAPETPGP
jgi:hypothetical protein